VGQVCLEQRNNVFEMRAPRFYATICLFTVTTGKAPLMGIRSSLDGMKRKALHRLLPFRWQANLTKMETASTSVLIESLGSSRTESEDRECLKHEYPYFTSCLTLRPDFLETFWKREPRASQSSWKLHIEPGLPDLIIDRTATPKADHKEGDTTVELRV
jgi:hypothetical protein